VVDDLGRERIDRPEGRDEERDERREVDEREREQGRREQEQGLRPAVLPEEAGEPEPGRP
jgi:hypothetical protein